MKHLPNLYAVRILLSLIVVIFHLPLISKSLNVPFYNNSPIFTKGPLAVYYFFVLSGFLILRIIFVEINKTRNFDFKNFYSRRIKRLYPVYYVVFFIGLILYHIILPILKIPFEINYSITELVSNYILIIPNVFRHNHPDVGSILIILWSIGVEEQFYLTIPIFMYLFKNSMVLSVSILCSILVLILIIYPSFYIYDNFYFYFLFGGILSISGLNKSIPILNNKILHIIVYSLFIISFTTNYFNFTNSFLSHLFTLIISGLLISLISDYPIFIIKNKTIDYLGKISYGIYMYHMIVITALVFLANKLQPYKYLNESFFIISFNLVSIFITFIVAHLSFKYFESIFYKSKH